MQRFAPIIAALLLAGCGPLVQVGGKPLDLGREVPKYEDHPDFGKEKPSIEIPDWVIRKKEEDKKNKTPIPQEPRWYDAGDSLAARVKAVAEEAERAADGATVLLGDATEGSGEQDVLGIEQVGRRVAGDDTRGRAVVGVLEGPVEKPAPAHDRRGRAVIVGVGEQHGRLRPGRAAVGRADDTDVAGARVVAQ